MSNDSTSPSSASASSPRPDSSRTAELRKAFETGMELIDLCILQLKDLLEQEPPSEATLANLDLATICTRDEFIRRGMRSPQEFPSRKPGAEGYLEDLKTLLKGLVDIHDSYKAEFQNTFEAVCLQLDTGVYEIIAERIDRALAMIRVYSEVEIRALSTDRRWALDFVDVPLSHILRRIAVAQDYLGIVANFLTAANSLAAGFAKLHELAQVVAQVPDTNPV